MKLPTPTEVVVAANIPNKQLSDFLSELNAYMKNPDNMRKSLISENNMMFKIIIGIPLSDWNKLAVIETLNTSGWVVRVDDFQNTHCPSVSLHIWPLDDKKVTA